MAAVRPRRLTTFLESEWDQRDPEVDQWEMTEDSIETDAGDPHEVEAPPWHRARGRPRTAPAAAPAAAPQPRTRPAAEPRGLTRRQRQQTMTGDLADFPTLGCHSSQDVVVNTAMVLTSRLITFKWKMMVWLVRVRPLMQQYRRPVRWLANLYANELASIWGHLGRCTQHLRGRDGPPMFR